MEFSDIRTLYGNGGGLASAAILCRAPRGRWEAHELSVTGRKHASRVRLVSCPPTWAPTWAGYTRAETRPQIRPWRTPNELPSPHPSRHGCADPGGDFAGYCQRAGANAAAASPAPAATRPRRRRPALRPLLPLAGQPRRALRHRRLSRRFRPRIPSRPDHPDAKDSCHHQGNAAWIRRSTP